MFTTTVIGAQSAMEDLRRAIEDFTTNDFVTIGVHQSENSRTGDDLNNATIGAIQEFGTDDGKIPPRPWLSPGVQSGNAEYSTIIANAQSNGENLSQALERVGAVAAGKTQVYMTELRTPPNAASTIKQKGSDNPLIDTGALRQSVTYKVTSTEPTEGI